MRWSMPDDAPLYMDITHHPLADATLRRYRGLTRSRAAMIRAVSPACASGRCRSAARRPMPWSSGICGVVYEICWYMRGLERWFMDMLEQPEFCEALIDRTLQFWLDWFDGVSARSRRSGRCDHDRRRSGRPARPAVPAAVLPIAWSSRGRNGSCSTSSRRPAPRSGTTPAAAASTYIPDLLDNGIDALNPVQISAAEMDPATLKARIRPATDLLGRRHRCPARAAPRRSRRPCGNMCGTTCETWMPGGGYVFNNVHNIQAGVPADNVLAMYDAAYEFGFYAPNS